MAKETAGGVGLLGFDVPAIVSAEEDHLRVIAAVECRDAAVAPPLVAVVVRDQGPNGNRVCSVRKYLPSDGTGVPVGLAVPFLDDGEHQLTVQVCAVCQDEGAEGLTVLFETTRLCRKEAAVARGPLPRLQHNETDALVLCGVDVPAKVEIGKMRVIVALKRTWHDAPSQLALIVRNVLPSGERRAAVVRKTLGDDADTIGLEVPMGEAGTHTISLQVAKVVDGEYVEVFRVDDREVIVTNPPAAVLAENEGLVLCGIDTPAHVEGAMRAIVALQRVRCDAPRHLCLIARNILPTGERRAAVVRKVLQGSEAQTIGIEVPMGEAGEHWVEFSVAECTDEGNVEIFFIPARRVLVTNPPAPRIQHSDAVVLCGVDICGARWPDLRAQPVVDGTGRVIVAVTRTWHDAPTTLIMTVHDEANSRKASVRKCITSCHPETLGLEVPMRTPGTLRLLVRVAAEYPDGSVRQLFEVPAVEVPVHALVNPAAVLAENEGLVLCGIDTPAHVEGAMRAIVALQRVRCDAPRHLCLIARNILPTGERRAAVVRKVLQGSEAQTIGIEVPMGEAGEHWVEFSVAECTDEGNVEIFFIPARRVLVTAPMEAGGPSRVEGPGSPDDVFSEPELVEQEEGEEEEEAELVAAPAVSEQTVSLKVGFIASGASEASVIRRLSVTLGVDARGRLVDVLDTVMPVLTKAFKNELDASASAPVLARQDEGGGRVDLASDSQLVAALRAPAKGGVVRLSLFQ